MSMMPAPQAPFAVGDAVRFLSDPDHVERIVECRWVFDEASGHWRLTTAWTDEGGQHIRVGDAAEFAPLGCSPEALQPRSSRLTTIPGRE